MSIKRSRISIVSSSVAANYSLFNDILINYVIIILTGVSLAIRYVINSNDVHKCLDDTSDDDIICR